MRYELPKEQVPAPTIAPIQFLQPLQPVPPSQPMQPLQPMQPIQSAPPIQPMQPVQPIHPVQPMQPMQPMQPFQPMSASQPASPISSQPMQPALAVQSGQTGPSSAPHSSPRNSEFDESTNYYMNRRRKRQTVSGARVSGVRLSNGTEGRVEVQLNGQWGGVCAYGFGIEAASIVCQQLGLVLNRKDWLLEKSEYPSQAGVEQALLSNVRCTRLDYELSTCESESRAAGEFDRSCFALVGIRCSQSSWSGVRFGMSAKASAIEHLVVQDAGLLDYSTNAFKPALQIDFNRFRLRNVRVNNNRAAGVGILWNDLFFDEPLEIRQSELAGNLGHGLESRSQGVQVRDCHFGQNRKSGFHYEPMFERLEQRELISWISPNDHERIVNLPADLPANRSVYIEPRQIWFVRLARPMPANSSLQFAIETAIGHSIGVMVLNPAFAPFTDELRLSYSNRRWSLRSNLSSFSMVHFVYKLTLEYEAGAQPAGDLILYLYARPIVISVSKSLAELEEEENRRVKSTRLSGCRFVGNLRGISAHHFDRDLGERGDFFHRYDNETFLVERNAFEQQRSHALLVSAPLYEPDRAQLAEVNYTLVANRLVGNRGGMLQRADGAQRSSNNLFHWLVVDCLLEQNAGGGLQLQLPAVWQHDENHTHTVCIQNNTFQRNRAFELSVLGHFAVLNLTSNLLRENHCQTGLISVGGMEKRMLVVGNHVEGNYGEFMLQFDLQSHTDRFGLVPASVHYNRVLRNRNHYSSRPEAVRRPFNYALAVRGVQQINITRNLLHNPELNYELLAGVRTSTLDSQLNVRENWWGTHNATQVRERIFDFDDWNSFALANYTPYLAAERLDALPVQVDPEDLIWMDFQAPLGGRLFRSGTLRTRPAPYVVRSDLTIMPGVLLRIEPGVTLEFYPSVGILALGNLQAIGTLEQPIRMRPLQGVLDATGGRSRRSAPEPDEEAEAGVPLRYEDLDEVRLCKSELCDDWSREGAVGVREGFLELFNRTTMQWVPVCDRAFSEQNAQVVCRQLRYSPLNVQVRRGSRADLGQTVISRVRHWPRSMQCDGRERRLAECEPSPLGHANHTNQCDQLGTRFVYVYCGPEYRGGANDYWGGVRFAPARFEPLGADGYYLAQKSSFSSDSRMQFVQITGAGLLHGARSAAVQVVQRDVNLEFVEVNASAWHGVEAIAPSGHLVFDHLSVHHNLGAGFHYLMLSGAANKNRQLPYRPLVESTLQANVFSLVDVCDLHKRLRVNQRLLVYHKYGARAVDCVKIFYTDRPGEKLGFRLLQFNLFNESAVISGQADFLRVHDGDLFNQTSRLMVQLDAEPTHGDAGHGQPAAGRTDRPAERFYQGRLESLSLRLHASAADGQFGFIGEVVSSSAHPLAGAQYANISSSDVRRNERGALLYRSAGESSAVLSLLDSSFRGNGDQLLGNFSTCDCALDLQLQNAPYFRFERNLVDGNVGGLCVVSYAHYLGAALKGSLIARNLFARNLGREALSVRAPDDGDSFQFVHIAGNYFTRNQSPYQANVRLWRVLCNFTQNVMVHNVGEEQLLLTGGGVQAHLRQEVDRNWLYANVAAGRHSRCTVQAQGAGARLTGNYLLNVQNDFELCAGNDSQLLDRRWAAVQELQAAENWWGASGSGFVSGRLREPRAGSVEHLRISYQPYLESNQTLLWGGCPGGWRRIASSCFLYVHARLSFHQARSFCEQENSTMPFVSVNLAELTDLLFELEPRYEPRFQPVWVQSFQYAAGECTALLNHRVDQRVCEHQLPFFCEKDPPSALVAPLYQDWHKHQLVIGLLAVSAATALFTLLCLLCWLCKSRQRYKQKLDRRNSLRASIRSNRSYSMSNGSLNEYAYKKHIEKAIQLAREQHQMPTIGQLSEQAAQQRRGRSSLVAGPASVLANAHPMAYTMAPTLLASHGGSSTFRVDPHGSYESFDPQQRLPPLVAGGAYLADSSFDGDSTHNYNTLRRPSLEDRFAGEAALENANIELLVKPTFDLTYENAGFKETPSVSRASNQDYADAREWSPVGQPFRETLSKQQLQQLQQIQQPGQSPGSGQYTKRKPSGGSAANGIAAYPMHSYTEVPPKSLKPLPPVARYRAQQLAPSTHQRKSSLPEQLDYDSAANGRQASIDRDLYAFGSRSQSTLLGGGSDVGSQDRRYLETSLDTDSVAGHSHIDLDLEPTCYSPSSSTATASTRREHPLETAM